MAGKSTLLRAYFETAPPPSLLIAGDGTILLANRAARDRWGGGGKLDGRSLFERFPEISPGEFKLLLEERGGGKIMTFSCAAGGENVTALFTPFTSGKERFLILVTSQTPFEEELNRRLGELSLLNAVTGEVSSTLDLQTILGNTLDRIAATFGTDAIGFYLYDEKTGILNLLGQRGLPPEVAEDVKTLKPGEGLAGRVAVERGVKVLDIEDVPEYKERPMGRAGFLFHTGVPLISKDRLVGTLSLGWKSERPLNEDQIRLLLSICSQIAVAIENAQLFNEAREHGRLLESLNEASRKISATLDVQALYRQVCVVAVDRLGFRMAWIGLCDEKTKDVLPAAQAGFEAGYLSTIKVKYDDSPLGKGPTGTAIKTGRPVIQRNIATAPSYLPWREEAVRRKYTASAALPLCVSEKVMGVLNVYGESADLFGREMMAILGAFANQVAIAMENARLYDNLSRSYRSIEEAKDELVRKEKLAALGEMSGVLAHEIRNPLAVIYNSVGHLKNVLSDRGGDVSVLLGVLDEEAKRLNRIVTDLTEFVRPRLAGGRKTGNIGEVMDAAVKEVRSDESFSDRIRILKQVEEDLGPVNFDPHSMTQALFNVMLNAVHAMPSGGVLTVAGRKVKTEGRAAVSVSISDTGSGNSPETMRRMFEPFFTTRASGSGLGLYLVKKIVDEHGGSIEVESEPEKGATFRIILPVNKPPA